jgi:wyosine [tRNA(Phe)-imidazoG37] synthetase (radical SAM superfamily)
MMARSLDNLANAAIQKNDTIEKLVVTNECLAKALADANAALLISVSLATWHLSRAEHRTPGRQLPPNGIPKATA